MEEGRLRHSRDRIILLGLDIKMFYGGPKEAIMHAIYRQNFGFTDIIIGRKHADAPYDDGKDIWDGLAAQRKFDELKGELLIKPVKVGFAAFYEELGRVGLVDEYGPKGYKQVSISGRDPAREAARGRTARPAHHAAGNGPHPDRAHEGIRANAHEGECSCPSPMRQAKRVLSVGQCFADHSGITRVFRGSFGAEVVGVDSAQRRWSNCARRRSPWFWSIASSTPTVPPASI